MFLDKDPVNASLLNCSKRIKGNLSIKQKNSDPPTLVKNISIVFDVLVVCLNCSTTSDALDCHIDIEMASVCIDDNNLWFVSIQN